MDLVCYRRHGHNEADEPAATQPLMYSRIRNHPTTLEQYAQRLCDQGVVTEEEVKAQKAEYRRRLEEGDPLPETAQGMVGNEFTVDWDSYRQADPNQEVDTAISPESVAELGERLGTVPKSVNLHPRVQKVVADRLQMALGDRAMDWGFAELMAYGSLLRDGYRVRFTGQDSRRGTFFHRHASLIDQHSGRAYSPLDDVAPKRGAFTITDSLLSEEAVMGFEYGYSTTDPDCLTIWEGQFGDFCNGAQVVIDQFIASGETKWGRMSGLTLFLPHAQEGAGTRALLRSPGTVPAVVRANEYASVRAFHAGPDVSSCAPPDAQSCTAAVGGNDAEEPAAQQTVLHAGVGAKPGTIPAAYRRGG